MESMKRRMPKPEPVSFNGIRYQVTRMPAQRGLGQNSGVISAVDEHTDQELWTLVVYPVAYDPDEERDVQDIFITQLAVNAAANALLVTNERRERFDVNLADRSVKKVD